jgi:hypothetical protein
VAVVRIAAVLSPRLLAAVLAASASLGAPAIATASSATADRLLAQSGKSSQNLTPTPQTRPPRQSPAPAPAPPPAARPSASKELPYTGLDARLLAAAGALLVMIGIGVRPRAADGAH